MELNFIQNDMRTALGIAQYISPIDTGNLRYNAIKGDLTADGFVIRFSLQDAFYIYFLEEGTRKFQGHKAFIGGQIVPAIASYINAKYATGDKTKAAQYRWYARIGNNEIANMSDMAYRRQQESLAKDLTAIESKYGWQTSEVDFYDKNFADKNMTDFIEYQKR